MTSSATSADKGAHVQYDPGLGIVPSQDWQMVKAELAGRVFDIVDFFSGCGGMSYGFHHIAQLTGLYRFVGAFDNNPHANATYERNLGIRPNPMNLACATLDDITKALPLRDGANPLIVIGCAPCQGFSAHRKKDPRKDSRNSLVGRFAEIAVGLEAELIVMENVPDLLAERHWHHFEAFKKVVEGNGYRINAQILNMAEYGVPQERCRVVVLASKRFTPTMPEPILSRGGFRTVRFAIGSLPPLRAGQTDPRDPMHTTSNHRRETVAILQQVPKDGGSRPPGVGPACLDRVAGFYDVYGRLHWDRPAAVITARCRTPSCGRFTHPEQDRGLSVREAAILQGFPEDYAFEGPFDDKFKQIGNAVPPIFSTHLAAHVLSLLAGRKHAQEGSSTVPSAPPFACFNRRAARGSSSAERARKPKVGQPTAIDCFCGAGGLSLGFARAGFRILYTSDTDGAAVRTYRRNLGPYAYADDMRDLTKERVESRIGASLGAVHVVLGGPPCQGFSVQRRGANTDARNDLVLEFVRFVLDVRPAFFVMENVGGLLSRRGEACMQRIRETCNGAGYHLHVAKLNAFDYGVPQIRKRVFIVGEHVRDILLSFTFPPPTRRLVKSPGTVREAIADLMCLSEDDVPNHRADRLSEVNLERIRAVSEGQGRDSLPLDLRLGTQTRNPTHRHLDTYGRMAWDEPAPTITARFDSFSRGRFGHPQADRTITLREGARLQSFPDDFVFEGTKVEVARQIGNAVPPLLAQALAQTIAVCLGYAPARR